MLDHLKIGKMKNLIKSPLTVIVAGLFMVAMGFGLSPSLEIKDIKSGISFLTLGSSVAQGESSCKYYWDYFGGDDDCPSGGSTCCK